MIHTMGVGRVSAETVTMMSSAVKMASALARVVERVRSLNWAVHVACTVLEGQVSWMISGMGDSCPNLRVEIPHPFDR